MLCNNHLYCSLLGYDIVLQSGRWVSMSQKNLLPPPSLLSWSECSFKLYFLNRPKDDPAISLWPFAGQFPTPFFYFSLYHLFFILFFFILTCICYFNFILLLRITHSHHVSFSLYLLLLVLLILFLFYLPFYLVPIFLPLSFFNFLSLLAFAPITQLF